MNTLVHIESISPTTAYERMKIQAASLAVLLNNSLKNLSTDNERSQLLDIVTDGIERYRGELK
jgi:hypothetical protein